MKIVIFIFLLFSLLACKNKDSKSGNIIDNIAEDIKIENKVKKNITTNTEINKFNEKTNFFMTHFVSDNLRIRESDDLVSSIITTLPKYTSIRIIETGKIETIEGLTAPWVKVISQTGYEGWCFSGFIEELANLRASYINTTNCIKTQNYAVPIFRNVMFGEESFHTINEPIIENDLRPLWSGKGFQIMLRNNIPFEKNYTIILKNTNYEFRKNLELIKVTDKNFELLGYYADVQIENKPWLNDRTNKWQLIVIADDDCELINKEISLGSFTHIFFDTIDDNLFTENNLQNVILNKEYTYRFKKIVLIFL